MRVETDHADCLGLSVDELSEYLFTLSAEISMFIEGLKQICAVKDAGNYNNKLQEDEWIPDEDPGVNDSSGIVSDEGLYTDITL